MATTTAPAARSRLTTSQSASAGTEFAPAAEGGHQSLDRELLLDDERYAVERAELAAGGLVRVARVGLGAGAVVDPLGDRVEPRVEQRDPLEGGVGHLPRGELAVGDETGGLGHAGDSEVGHGRSAYGHGPTDARDAEADPRPARVAAAGMRSRSRALQGMMLDRKP